MRNEKCNRAFTANRCVWVLLVVCFYLLGDSGTVFGQRLESVQPDNTYGPGGKRKIVQITEEDSIRVIIESYDPNGRLRKEEDILKREDGYQSSSTEEYNERGVRVLYKVREYDGKASREIDRRYKPGEKMSDYPRLIEGFERIKDKTGKKTYKAVNRVTGRMEIASDPMDNPVEFAVGEIRGYVNEIEKFREEGKTRFVGKGLKDAFDSAYAKTGGKPCGDCYLRVTYIAELWGRVAGSDSPLVRSERNLVDSIDYLRETKTAVSEKIFRLEQAIAAQRERQERLVGLFDKLLVKEAEFWKIFFQRQAAAERASRAKTPAEEAPLRLIEQQFAAQQTANEKETDALLKDAKRAFFRDPVRYDDPRVVPSLRSLTVAGTSGPDTPPRNVTPNNPTSNTPPINPNNPAKNDLLNDAARLEQLAQQDRQRASSLRSSAQKARALALDANRDALKAKQNADYWRRRHNAERVADWEKLRAQDSAKATDYMNQARKLYSEAAAAEQSAAEKSAKAKAERAKAAQSP